MTGPDRDRSETSQTPAIDKSTWGNGPWQTEPDRVDWTHAGLPCLVLRQDRNGHWCGYAAVPPGHPLHGKDYDGPDVQVHGGLTYANRCNGDICHVAQPGEPDDVWWFGFDCCHAGDFAPALHERLRQYGYPGGDGRRYDHAAAVAAAAKEGGWHVEVYRTLAYVQAETNQLAEQLAAIGPEAQVG